ncbi:MAG: tyrosine-type recombinase/integrase [Marivivens sp.]|nr:tyrosine-type recombinase/integrase [Marivivens sp.]
MDIESLLEHLDGAYAPATLRAYRTDLGKFLKWCAENGETALPANASAITSYLEAEAERAVATVERRLYSIRKIHALFGHPDPCASAEAQIAIRRFKRSKPNRPRQVLGISHDTLVEMLESQQETLHGIRNRALLSLGFDFLTRRSELSALREEDIAFLADGTVQGLIRRSKNDQLGLGRTAFGSRRSAQLLETWLEAKDNRIPWLFCPIANYTCMDRPLSTSQIRLIIKSAARDAGKAADEVDEISGHSLRIGAAQELMMRGLDMSAIMRAGGWKTTDVVARYVQCAEHNVWE